MWATRPSLMLQERDDVRAFLLDEALGIRLLIEDAKSRQDRDKRQRLPDGLIYAPASVYPPDPSGPLASPHPELLN